MSRIIHVIGPEGYDFVHYMALVAYADGKDVLVLDNSEKNTLLKSFDSGMNGGNVINTGHYCLAGDIAPGQKTLNIFETIICFHGIVPDKTWLLSGGARIIHCSMCMENIEALTACIPSVKKSISGEGYVVCRDVATKKYGASFLKDILPSGLDVLESYEIPSDAADIAAKQFFAYEGGRGTMKGVSSDLKDAVFGIYAGIESIEEKELKKLIGFAKKTGLM